MRDLYFQFCLILDHLKSLNIFQNPGAREEEDGKMGEIEKGD